MLDSSSGVFADAAKVYSALAFAEWGGGRMTAAGITDAFGVCGRALSALRSRIPWASNDRPPALRISEKTNRLREGSMGRVIVIPSKFTGRQQLVVNADLVQEVIIGRSLGLVMTTGKTINVVLPDGSVTSEVLSFVFGEILGDGGADAFIAIHAACGRYLNPRSVVSIDHVSGGIWLTMIGGQDVAIPYKGFSDFQVLTRAVFGKQAADQLVMYTPPPEPSPYGSAEEEAKAKRRDEMARRVVRGLSPSEYARL